MSKQVSKSGLSAKLGSAGRSGFDEHKGDDTTLLGGGELPDGIDPGVAQLVECKFDVFKTGANAGEYYFLAAGVVVEPKIHNGIPVAGLRTQIGPEPLCDTPIRSRQDVNDHLGWILNEFRKLGINTESIGFDDLESVAAALKDAGPHFRFRTWKGQPTDDFPNPRTNHDWRGQCDYNGEVASAVTDETETSKETGDELSRLAESADGGDDEAKTSLTSQAEAAGYTTEQVGDAGSWSDVADMVRNPVGETSVITGAPIDEPVDYDALGEQADASDEVAIEVLTKAAGDSGLDPDVYPTWAELAAALVSSGGSSTSEPATDWKPEKGDIYFYKNPQAKEETEHEVTAVFEGAKKVNLKRLSDQKSFKSVPWDKLNSGE